jgi:outer membrane receptor protein involved in Fe transport
MFNRRASRGFVTFALRVFVLGSVLGLFADAASGAPTNLTCKADLTVKETYDNNVYLQDVGPLAHQESFVTSVTPRVGLDYKPCPGFGLSAAYAPEVARYHAESSENYVAHRATLNLAGKVSSTAWEQSNSLTWIDGNQAGPLFTLPEDVPAIGGIPLRDRRAATIWRNSFRLTHPIGKWFVRPVATAYIHDFQTDQRASPPGLIYENYIDRQDVNGGLDVGYELCKGLKAVVGYRYGQQDQFLLRGANSPYDSSYNRALVGLEGQPAEWIKINALAGPDMRDFGPGTPLGFRPDEMLYWVDAAVTLMPTKLDTVALSLRRYEQPAFSSHSVYEDITYDANWRHKCSGQFSATAGFRMYVGDWQAPVSREDWIYTPYLSVAYVFDKHVSFDVAYSYDWVESKVPNRAGREFTRHLASLGVKYTF